MKDILNAREKRWNYTNELLEKYDLPVITITLNIPGANKCKEDYLYIHDAITKDFIGDLYKYKSSILYFESRVDKDGPESFIVINIDSKTLKQIGVKFEQSHILGRIADIDIKDKNKVWSRIDLNLEERKCLLCNNSARKCILSHRHSLKEVLLCIEETICTYRMVGENK